MSTLTSTLLDFILSLLKDPQQAQAFNDSPEQALSDAGLGDVCGADVQALMPMLSDYAPAGVSPYQAPSSYAPSSGKHTQGRDNYQPGPEHDGGYQAIQQIKYVQENYSYQSSRTLDFSHSVWGDQYNVWADDSAVGINGSVVAGDDIKDADIKAVNNTGDGSAVGFGNHVNNDGSFNSNSGDGNAFGSGAETDAFNTQDSYNNNGNDISGGANVLGDDNDVDNTDSGNNAGDGGLAGDGTMNDSNNYADDGGNSGEDGQVDNSSTDVGPIDVGGVAIAGQNAVAGQENDNVNDSQDVVQDADIDDSALADGTAINVPDADVDVDLDD